MNARIQELLNYIRDKKHYQFRRKRTLKETLKFLFIFFTSINRSKRSERILAFNLGNEKPIILPQERIVFTRHVKNPLHLFIPFLENHILDYETTIKVGLEGRRKTALDSLQECEKNEDKKGQIFLKSVIKVIDAIKKLSDRYAAEAKKQGNDEVYDILTRIPRNGAASFHEALQFMRILQFVARCDHVGHAPLGRFDQYMYPYLKSDLDGGKLDDESAMELLQEYFISCAKDADLYFGVQVGDNGQSLVLGGVDMDGNDAYNQLSEMCLKASAELKIIDPKINLRIHKNTPIEIYKTGTRLTKEGLGFPQYSNDDIVIPALVKLGYDLKDARNYGMAACWEFIIPGCGREIVNIDALSFPKVIDKALRKDLEKSNTFEIFLEKVNHRLIKEFLFIHRKFRMPIIKRLISFFPSTYKSLLSMDSLEKGTDISEIPKYKNIGIHGPGLASGTDSLAVIRKHVFEEKTINAGDLVRAVKKNFEGYDDIRQKCKYDSPKMGNNDDYADELGTKLLHMFADALGSKRNFLGGKYRPGTGSAMYYIWSSKWIGASPDGRKKGEPLPANYSPALNVKLDGPVSVISSFTKPDLSRAINGGPLTLELHDTVFRNEEGMEKTAMFVKSSMDMGLHQLQLNAINRDTLLDAQAHPENYKNLIVRVWGWSGYFVELGKPYQDHIIQRVEMTI